MKSKKKKINSLFKKKDFELVFILKMLKNIKIFNSCFVNKIKNIKIANAFEKLRLIIEIYNNYNKMSIFI